MFAKRLFFVISLLAIFSQAAQAKAAFRLGTNTVIVTSGTAYSDTERGTWSDWRHCENVHDANSAIRGFFLWQLPDAGNFEKSLISCRTIDSDGTFSTGYTFSTPFFDTADSGTSTTTQTDMSQLPTGLGLYWDSTLMYVYLIQTSAADIVDGIHNWSYATNYAGMDPLFYEAHQKLECASGYVMTGMRVKQADALWPYNGKVITRVSITCTELVEY